MSIVPAIIPESFEHLEQTLHSVKDFAHEVQIDIVDGAFVPFTSWPHTEGSVLEDLKEFTTSFEVEMDLMVMHPETYIDAYASLGVARIVVHLESCNDIESVLKHRKTHEYALGLSILNDTPLDVLFPFVSEIDYVQFMGIARIGSQGQPFDSRVLSRVREMHKRYPNMPISIDGSVNQDTVPPLREAGAERFVVGSAILRDQNPESAYQRLAALG